MSALLADAFAVVVLDGELVLAEDPADPGTGTTQDPMREDLETTDVSPGLEGFLAIFAVVVVTVFLLLSMTKKLRGVAHRTGTESRVDGQFVDRAPSTAGTGDASSITHAGTPDTGDALDIRDTPDDGSARGA